MNIYLKIFNTEQEYNTYSGGTGFVTPNVSYIVSGDTIKYDNNEIKYYTEDSWLEAIPQTAYTASTFDMMYAVKKIDIPSGVTSINNYAFTTYRNLEKVTIPDSVTSIGIEAFGGCSGLTSVNIPSGVTGISRLAFDGCRSLTSIDLPSGLTSISDNAFLGCRSLTSIDIPSGVTSIGDYAFSSCSGLTSITVNATTPPTLGENVFNNTNNCPIYVPSESVETYKAASGWSSYASRIQAIQNN